MIPVATTILFASAWLASSLARSAATRHLFWTLGVVGALLVPVLAWLVPALPALPEPSSIAAPALVASLAVVPASAHPDWLADLWAVGTVLVSVRLVRGHLAAWRLVREAHPIRMEGIPRHVAMRESTKIISPMTIGALRPCIVMPAAADTWPQERLRTVLLHELAHVRRHDALVQLLASVACAAYWWNPLAWLAARRLRVEREHACDDLVLAAGVRPSGYAADLLSIAREISFPVPTALAAVGPSGTEARIRRVLDPSQPRATPTRAFRLASAGVALALATTLACAPPAAPAAVAAAPAPAPTTGMSDEAFVANEARRGLGNVDECFSSGPYTGTLQVHWAIDAAGKTVESCITSDTLGDEAARTCVNRHIERGTFPALAGRSVEVTFPFGG